MSEEDSHQQLTPAKKIITFLSEELEIPAEKINLTSRLRQDLGLEGDSAADLLEAYSLLYDVEIDAFRINDYFGAPSELNPLLAHFLWIFGNSRPLKTLTVADLIRALDTKELK